jgi:HSP20 family protein
MATPLRFFQVAFPAPSETMRPAVWQPSADIYRTPTGWLVKFDLAGVRPEDVEVEVRGSILTVRGCRRDWAVEQDAHCYQMEISYSCFERALTLPANLERARVSAEHRYGMLLVRIHQEDTL